MYNFSIRREDFIECYQRINNSKNNKLVHRDPKKPFILARMDVYTERWPQ